MRVSLMRMPTWSLISRSGSIRSVRRVGSGNRMASILGTILSLPCDGSMLCQYDNLFLGVLRFPVFLLFGGVQFKYTLGFNRR